MPWVSYTKTPAVTNQTLILFKYTAEKTLSYSINTLQNLKLERNLSMRKGKKRTHRALPVSYHLFFSSSCMRGEPFTSPKWKPGLFRKPPQLASDGWEIQSPVS